MNITGLVKGILAAACILAAHAGTADAQNASDQSSNTSSEQSSPEGSGTQNKSSAKEASTADAAKKTSTADGKDKQEGASLDSASKPADDDKTGSTSGKRPGKLTVASWGGAYTEAQKRAYFSPFETKTGISIAAVAHNGRFEALTGKDDGSASGWDIVDLDEITLEAGCRSGVLEKVETQILAASGDGETAKADFIEGSLHECGIPSVVWSSAIVYDKRAFEKAKPDAASDFFDVKKFPGLRALPREPRYVVELALMADGVKPADVYDTLATSEGLERAFKQLDRIADDISWWHVPQQPIKLLENKQAAMAIAFNGRIFNAIVANSRPFEIIWDGQVFHLDYWAVPKTAPHKTASLDFISFATRPDSMARQASWFPYGPVRKSAVKLVGKHPEIDVNMARFLPTSPDNFRQALKFDPAWWEKNGKRISDRYIAWMDTIDDPSSYEDEQNRP